MNIIVNMYIYMNIYNYEYIKFFAAVLVYFSLTGTKFNRAFSENEAYLYTPVRLCLLSRSLG